VKPDVSQAEVKPTVLAARGITGAKLKSIGAQEIEFRLGNRVYTHEILVTSLDVEYSGGLVSTSCGTWRQNWTYAQVA